MKSYNDDRSFTSLKHVLGQLDEASNRCKMNTTCDDYLLTKKLEKLHFSSTVPGGAGASP